MKTLVPLTSTLKIEQGSHILYFYNKKDEYIENAASYILAGIDQGHHIVFIDSEDRFAKIKERLGSIDLSHVHYVNNYDFYEMYQDFHFERILNNLSSIVVPYVEHELTVRIWGHVDWMEQDNITSKLHTYECKCDITIAGLGYTTVCAYDAESVPANILLEMMRSHEFLMTDNNITRSTLYKTSNEYNPTAFPSLSIQTKIDSEIDLYKQKLDFVHVVSHEVRNPLTVIKAYSKLLKEQEHDRERVLRLQAIYDSAVVIDNEISHIITTEQMLSTDAFWQKNLIFVKSAVDEVVEIMKIKGQTQNIKLATFILLSGKEMVLSNFMGFKMIVSNLLSNAIKYSEEGSIVTLEVFQKDEQLIIVVADNGVGMTKEQLSKLYIKYEKTNQEQSGQGIGLFMVKKLVAHFDGEIEVESEVGKGTKFQVTLPIIR
ncbi:MEDS domain-containing protein [Alkalihalobacterium bogoriense]|uniref:MEDS domain-containing protein n=1 Tax=Alkalihalobacterium bogoriense TaxID=246272 RepID=UPI00047E678A|nr:MEDS domain-containing protein [Alkalihalobacterium bogoriense]